MHIGILYYAMMLGINDIIRCEKFFTSGSYFNNESDYKLTVIFNTYHTLDVLLL